MSLLESFESSLSDAPWILGADRAAVELARKLAASCDAAEGKDLAVLGRLFNEVLGDLGLTVVGRSGKPEVEGEVNELDRIREQSAARLAKAKTKHETREASESD